MDRRREQINKTLDSMASARLSAVEREIVSNYRDVGDAVATQLTQFGRKYGDGNGKLTLGAMERLSPQGSAALGRKVNRLQWMERQIDERVMKILVQNDAYQLRAVQAILQDGYYQNAWATAMQVGVDLPFGPIAFDAVEQLVAYPLSNLADSTVMSLNRREVVVSINRELRRGITLGEGYGKIAKRVDFVLGYRSADGKVIVDKRGELYKSLRIVRTEGNRAYSAGHWTARQRAEKLGVISKRQWLATLDGQTRDRHGALDGTYADEDGLFRINGFSARFPGDFGDGSMDINCRCRVIDVIEGLEPSVRRSRDEGVIPYESYESYAKRKGIKLVNAPAQFDVKP